MLGEFPGGGEGEGGHPALGRGVGGLADLAVVGGDRGGGDEDAALAVHGLGLGDALGGEPEDVEGADEVDSDHPGEGVQAQWSAAGEHAAGRRDAGTADRDAQWALLARRVHRGLYGVGVGDVAGDEADAGADVRQFLGHDGPW